MDIDLIITGMMQILPICERHDSFPQCGESKSLCENLYEHSKFAISERFLNQLSATVNKYT